MSNHCRICQSTDLKEVFKAPNMPLTSSVPLDESGFEEEILVELNFVQCQNCSLIQSKSFQPSMLEKIYTKDYSASIPSSPRMFERLKIIADDAITQENIANQCIIEIGASDFAFAELLIDRGARQIIAFEPSALFQTENPRIHHLQEFFSPEKIPVESEEIDLIVMRHVLEHVPDPAATIGQIASSARLGLKLYIEVPNTEDIIKNNRFFDFWYEHVSYFNPDLLKRLLESFGFTTLKVTPIIGGQHFGLLCEKTESTFSQPKTIKPAENIQSVEGFKVYQESFLKKLREVINMYDKIAIYGAGAQGIYIASMLDLNSERVKYFFDLNQMKVGKYAPKTHIPITLPEKEKLQDLDAIIIMATLHQDAMASDLRSKFAFTKDIWGTYPDVFNIV